MGSVVGNYDYKIRYSNALITDPVFLISNFPKIWLALCATCHKSARVTSLKKKLSYGSTEKVGVIMTSRLVVGFRVSDGSSATLIGFSWIRSVRPGKFCDTTSIYPSFNLPFWITVSIVRQNTKAYTLQARKHLRIRLKDLYCCKMELHTASGGILEHQNWDKCVQSLGTDSTSHAGRQATRHEI